LPGRRFRREWINLNAGDDLESGYGIHAGSSSIRQCHQLSQSAVQGSVRSSRL
jgi:hypothetical protein